MRSGWLRTVRIVTFAVVLLFAVSTAFSQMCKVGATDFKCPEYFKAVKVSDPSISVFKYTESGNPLYFFIADPAAAYSAEAVGKAVLGLSSPSATPDVKWKEVTDPLVMSTRTKYKYKLTALMGLSSEKFVEVKSFAFDLKGSKLVLGYVSDWSEDGIGTNQRRFAAGKGFADNASGCNAVVTILNSITREFKEPRQYCYLSGLGGPR